MSVQVLRWEALITGKFAFLLDEVDPFDHLLVIVARPMCMQEVLNSTLVLLTVSDLQLLQNDIHDVSARKWFGEPRCILLETFDVVAQRRLLICTDFLFERQCKL